MTTVTDSDYSSRTTDGHRTPLRSFRFKAFLSYSHAADGSLAPAIQAALHRIARPWYRLRSMWIFRDKTGLSVTPYLWGAIEAALAESEYFLLMASPAAKTSKWVQQEVDWWLAKRGARNLLVLLTDGDARWDVDAKDWDWTVTTSLPPSLKGQMTGQPLWVDLRWAKDAENLSLRHAQFRGAILDIAGTLLDTPKELLDSEDIRIYRRNRSAALAAVIISLLLAIGAATGALIANHERILAKNEASRADQEAVRANRNADDATKNAKEAHLNQLAAEARERIARSRALAIQARESRAEPDTALLLSLAAMHAEQTPDAESALLGTMLAYPRLESSLYAWHDAANRQVQALASTPDGRTLVAGYQDGSILRWNGGELTGSYLRRPLGGWLSSVSAIAFSPDGRYLAAAISDGSILCWDGKEKHWLPPIWLSPAVERRPGSVPNSRAEALAFNPKTGLLAAGQYDGRIRLWEVRSGRQIGDEFGDPIPPDQNDHKIGVQSLAFTFDGSLLASGHGSDVVSGQTDSKIRIWQASDSYRAVKVIRTNTSGVVALAVQPGKYRVAYAGSSAAVELSDMVGTDHRTLQLPNSAPGVGREGATALAFSANGNILAAGFADGRVALWHGIDSIGDEASVPDVFASGHRPFVSSAIFVPQRNLFATGGPDGVVRLWHSRLQAVGQPFGELSTSNCVFSPDSAFLTCIGLTGTLEWWDVGKHSRIAKYPLANHESVVGMAFISAKEVEILRPSSPPLRCTRKSCAAAEDRGVNRTSEPASLAPGNHFWFEWREHPYRCTARGCKSLPGPAQYGNDPNAYSSDGLRWVVRGWKIDGSPGGTATFCQPTGCRQLDVGSGGPSAWIGGMEFNPSGSLLVVGIGDGRVIFFDGRSGVRLGPPITAHSGGVERFAFSSDGAKMASGGRDGTVVLWDIGMRQPIGTPFPRPGLDQVRTLLFEPDGRHLLVEYVGGPTGGAALLNVDVLGYWQARACQATGRDLSLFEWNLHGSGSPFEPACASSPHPPRDWEPRPPAPF